LRGATTHSLHLAQQKGLKTIAFPAIGAGIGGFPARECAEIMLRAAVEHLRQPTSLETVYFILYDQPTFETFAGIWEKMQRELRGKATAGSD
jgi:O-acetyl-ADP-ribose deacetylase (regulator of RNase III)